MSHERRSAGQYGRTQTIRGKVEATKDINTHFVRLPILAENILILYQDNNKLIAN